MFVYPFNANGNLTFGLKFETTIPHFAEHGRFFFFSELLNGENLPLFFPFHFRDIQFPGHFI